MSEIITQTRTQVIIVDARSGHVSVISAGPAGPAGPPGPGGFGTALVISIPITLFTALPPSASYSWTEVDITCYAAMFVRLTIHSVSTISFAVKITSQPSGAGEVMYDATGFPTNDDSLSWPWWFNNDDTPRAKKMYIGIKNLGGVNSTFSITDLRGYALED